MSFNLLPGIWGGNLGSVQVHNLPAFARSIEHNGSSIEKSNPVIQMKCRDCYISKNLNLQIFGLNVHVWRFRLAPTNLIEDQLECLLERLTPTGALGETARIEDGGVVRKCQSERFPVEIIECTDELCESSLNLRLRSIRLRLRQE